MRKPSCRYDEIRIRITLYRSHVRISDVVPEKQQYAMNRRFSKIFVPATIHKLSRVIRIVRSRVWEAAATAACDVETRIPDFHDAIVSPSTATCSITTVHCTPVMFHALRTTIAVDPADYRARKRREKSVGRSFDRPRRHFLKSVRGGARRSWRNRRFIYLSAAWKKPWVPHEVLYLSCKP